MRAKRVALAVALGIALAGCQNPAAPPEPPPKIAVTAPAPAAADLDEQCANNLHKLEELLLMYAAVHQELPPSLDKLVPLNDGKPVPTRCPAGTDYVYVPGGLVAKGDSRVLILYDAAPVHRGKRQAILLTPPGKNDQAAVMDVVFITDDILKAFHAPPDAKK